MAAFGLPDLTLAEAISIAPNPYPIIIRSKAECGISGTGYVATLTNKFTRCKTLPHPPQVVVNAIGQELTAADVLPVTEEDWPALRDLLHKQKVLGSIGFKGDTTFNEMMIAGFRCLLDSNDIFELASFPTVFPMGRGAFCEKRPTPLLFPEYYKHICRMSTFNPESSVNWLVWCQMIEAAALIVEKKVRDGSMQNERRHFSFLQSCCAICGPRDEIKRCSRCHVMGYCGREHQMEDFNRGHKKLCKKYQRPGDPL
mmetsp:Transcript_5282/g.7383  ORF Transcript_5282/g.7383 Transcript_5282/m.7383 type:complete len:256 (+) Transcript_5282:71-838(+)